jgi:hypothetical protein
MAANKYVALITGKLQEVFATIISAGVANANQIPALDATGHLDSSVMPVGIAPEVIIVTTSEALAAGAFVNIFNNAGALNARNADNTTNAKPAHGFVLTAFLISTSATVYTLAQRNTQLSSLTIGSDYFLGTVGGVTTTPPSTTGNIVQFLGRADSTTSLIFVNENTIQVG